MTSSTSSLSSSQTSSLLNNQFVPEIPLTYTLPSDHKMNQTTFSSTSLQSSSSSSSITVDRTFLMQIMAQVAQTNQSQNEQLNQKQQVDSLLLPNGGRYTGYVLHGKPQGTGKLIYSSKETRKSYEGEFVNGLPNGVGIVTFREGDTYDGEMVEGRIEGQGTYFYPSGKSKYIGTFKNNKINGQGKFEYINRDEKVTSTYVGAWENGLQHGFGRNVKTYYIGGIQYSDVHEGIWKNGKPPCSCDDCVIQ